MKRTSIYKIQIETNDADHGHHEITVMASTYLATEPDTCHLYNDVTQADLWRAGQHVAGMLGRVAAWAIPYMEEQRREHKCSVGFVQPSTGPLEHGKPFRDGGCHIGAPWELMRPSSDYGAPAAIYFIVPSKRVKHWRGLIAAWLGALADEQANGWQTREPPPNTAPTADKVRRIHSVPSQRPAPPEPPPVACTECQRRSVFGSGPCPTHAHDKETA